VIRPADPQRDAAACAAIYRPYVESTVISLEAEAPTEAEFARRIATTAERYPWLVDEDDEGEIAGYAYASQHHPRAGYRWAVDVAVYVDAARQRRGTGRRLYEELFERVRELGYRNACAGIGLPNDASVGLHEALGFEHVGTFPRVAWKLGDWVDVGWWQLELAPAGDGPPSEPRRP
jgi:phosphinothricin acetyltransferase